MRPASPFGQDHRIQVIYVLDEILFLIESNHTRGLACTGTWFRTIVGTTLFHEIKIYTTVVYIIPLPMRLQFRLWLTKTDVIHYLVHYLI